MPIAFRNQVYILRFLQDEASFFEGAIIFDASPNVIFPSQSKSTLTIILKFDQENGTIVSKRLINHTYMHVHMI